MSLLLLLARNQGRVVTKDEIFEELWSDTFVGDEVLWRRISELRSALEDDPKKPRVIQTIPKKGYRLKTAIESVVEPSSEFPRASIEGEVDGVLRRTSGNVPARWKDYRIVSLALAACLLLATGLFYFWGTLDSRSGLTHKEKPTILIARFENLTGESVLDGTLEFALEQNLLGTRQVDVASQLRIQGILQLMRRDDHFPVDESLAREVSIRDGSIDYILTGRIERLDEIYTCAFRIMEPESGRVLAVSTRRVDDRGMLLPLIQDQTSWIVDTLEPSAGEVGTWPAADRVTTTSLEALSLYSRAVQDVAFGDRQKQVEALLKQAVAEDPGFAAAHLLLARTLRMTGRIGEAKAELQTAMQLRSSASLPERAAIDGFHHFWEGDLDRAAPHFEIVLEHFPQYFFIASYLVHCYREMGKPGRAVETLLRRAKRAPSNLIVQESSAALLIHPLGRMEEARRLLHRASELLQEHPEVIAERVPGAYTLSFGVWEKWLEGDIDGAATEADRVREKLASRKGPGVDLTRDAAFLGSQYLALGRVKEAEEVYRDYRAKGVLFSHMLALVTSDPALLTACRCFIPS